ncbi:hypothetical protein [Spirillospora sp. CA-294931]|uniref:hypothetical protein n=1 Tax=Spirillospora sp. CA-294931 TaxID=3240042 RepID=UPI003D9357CF
MHDSLTMRPAVAISRTWALWSAMALAAVAAALHTFVLTDPNLDALMNGDAKAESQQGLRMMWHGMSAIAWTYPVVLLLMPRYSASTTRPILGCVALLNGSQAVLYAVAGIWVHGVSGTLAAPEWTLYAAVAVLAWLARPTGPAETHAAPPRRSRKRLALLWFAMVNGALNAIFHTVLATATSWPDGLLDSDTAADPKLTLYAMWLFSCVLFCAVMVTLAWSLRTSAPACRPLLRYLAALVAILAVSWGGAIALGGGSELPVAGAISLGLQATLAFLSAPPRSE